MNKFRDATFLEFLNVTRIRHTPKENIGSLFGNDRPFYLVVLLLDHKNWRQPNMNLQTFTTFRSKKLQKF